MTDKFENLQPQTIQALAEAPIVVMNEETFRVIDSHADPFNVIGIALGKTEVAAAGLRRLRLVREADLGPIDLAA